MASMNPVTEGKMKKAQKSPAPRRIDVATRLDELTELAIAEFDNGYAGVAFALQSAEGEVDVGFVRHEDARDRINEIPGLWPSYRLGESFFPEPKPEIEQGLRSTVRSKHTIFVLLWRGPRLVHVRMGKDGDVCGFMGMAFTLQDTLLRL